MIVLIGLCRLISMKGKSTKPKKEITTMKTLIKTTTGALRSVQVLASVVAVALAFSISGTALAGGEAQVCGPETLSGSYIFVASGFSIVDGVAQPKAIVEGIDFNGDGTLTSPFATVSLNGVIIRSTNSVGTYTVAADCTGTLAFTAGPSFDIYVGRGAKEISMIQTAGPVPAVFQGLAKKVSN
jgi:hypothetical protein